MVPLELLNKKVFSQAKTNVQISHTVTAQLCEVPLIQVFQKDNTTFLPPCWSKILT